MAERIVNVTKKLSSIIALSERMLSAAESGDWTATAMLEEQRGRLIQELNLVVLEERTAQRFAEGLQKVLEINTRLVELGKKEMAIYSSEMRRVAAGRRAVTAYGR